MPIGYGDILHARRRIAATVRVTPMEPSPSLSARLGVPVHLKLEHRQATGSFKLRGATNAVLSLSPAERGRGVVGVSTGNHGRGLAQAAAANGVPVTVAMSRLVPENKVAAIRDLGATVIIAGESQDEAQEEVDRLVAQDGLTMIPPFDHPAIVAGQGTLGVEAMEQVPDAATVLVPVSGGGLAAGVALAVKTANPRARIVGLTMENGAAMHASLAAGAPVQVPEVASLADSLGGGIGLDNAHTFAMVRDLVDEIVLLSEAEIAEGIRHAYWQEGEVIEGGGAVGLAAVLAGKVAADGPTVILLTGRNIDPRLHFAVLSGYEPTSP